MNDRVFRGRNVAEARLAAVEKLGPDAVVLTTRSVARSGVGGWFGASDVEIAARAPAARRGDPSGRASDVPFAAGVYGAAAARTTGSEVSALRTELKGDIRSLSALVARRDDSAGLAGEIERLREVVEALAAERRGEPSAKVAAHLRALGVEGPAATALARSLGGKSAAGEPLREELARVLRVAPWPLDAGRTTIALIGPSGVGKTTTAAKLAARARADGRSVSLVGCDSFRVGATEQLASYADLIGADLASVRTSDVLRDIIDGSESEVVIVDTQGRPPMADGVELALAPPRRSDAPSTRARHVLLCLPAAVRSSDASRFARQYGRLAPTSLVITKIDETDSPAGILHASWATELPLSVVCFGQRVPEDIAAPTVGALVDYVAPRASEAERS